MIFFKKIAFISALLVTYYAQADIHLDGKINEIEWQTAKEFSSFVVTSPDTGKKPTVNTRVKLVSNKSGLYFAFINQQNVKSRSRKYSAKDQHTAADFNAINIDFSGQGDTLYEFVVTLGNGSMDGVYSRGNQFDADWEGAWDFKISEDEKNWIAEIFIPWAIAPYYLDQNSDLSKINLFFSRYFIEKGEAYSFPDTSAAKANFMQSLHSVDIAKPKGSTLELFPYVSVKSDFKQSDNKLRFGGDLLWKPTANQQITAAINPDFGQAESDELVANFSAVETLYSDKRAFFTENQSLFDVKGDSHELLNTRRMGGSSDISLNGESSIAINQPTDILAAVKYLNTSQTLDLGVMAVLEDDPDNAKGKEFFSTRWLVKSDNGYLGQIINWVDRATIKREALTSAIDFGLWQDKINFNGKVFGSKIQNFQENQSNTIKGYGSEFNLKYQNSRQWHTDFSMLWLDDKVDLNDMGYLARNDIKQLGIFSEYLYLPSNENSYFRDFNLSFDGKTSTNSQSESLANELNLSIKATTKNNAKITSKLRLLTSGYDDLITRGHGSVKIPERQDWSIEYQSPYSGKLHYQFGYHHLQEGIKGWADSLQLSLDYAFADNLMFSTQLFHLSSDDWLIGNNEGQLISYRRKFNQYSVNLLWLLAENQELSIKSQWFGVKANNGGALSDSTEWVANNRLVDDFKQSQLSMQIRYRYRFAALSDFYVVYVRNGGYYQQGDNLLSDEKIFNQQFDHPDDHQLLVKMRMRF